MCSTWDETEAKNGSVCWGTGQELQRFKFYGTHPGGFLFSFLSQNTDEQRPAADAEMARQLPQIKHWVLTNLPLEAYGTKEKTEKWDGLFSFLSMVLWGGGGK